MSGAFAGMWFCDVRLANRKMDELKGQGPPARPKATRHSGQPASSTDTKILKFINWPVRGEP
jgi:hypothetical protein